MDALNPNSGKVGLHSELEARARRVAERTKGLGILRPSAPTSTGTAVQTEDKGEFAVSAGTGPAEKVDESHKLNRGEVDKPRLDAALKKLDGLVGLEGPKTYLRELVATARFRKWEQEYGIESPAVSYNTVYLGEAGTGKTTIAEIHAEILAALGLLDTRETVRIQIFATEEEAEEGRGKDPDMISVTARDFIGGFQGQTGEKAGTLLDQMKGRVGFIDEAYNLFKDHNDMYGKEALTEIVAFMENQRDNSALIFAGYGPETTFMMEEGNSGFLSRVTVLEIENYTYEELRDIIHLFVSRNGYEADEADVNRIAEEVSAGRDTRGFGNARAVRQRFEKAYLRRAQRLVSEYADKEITPPREELMRFKHEDFFEPEAKEAETANE